MIFIKRYIKGEDHMQFTRSSLMLLLVLCIGFGSTVDAATKKQKAIAKFVTGEVLYQKKGKGSWKKVKVGSKVRESDMVRTFVESSVQLLLASGSQITVEENTIVKMSELVQDGQASSTNINVKKGRVLFNIKKLAERKSKFKFETLTATAAIRGTRGGIGFTGKRAFAYLTEGRLELRSRSGKKVDVNPKDFVIESEKGFEVKKLEKADDLKNFLKVLIEEAASIDIKTIDSTLTDSVVIDTTTVEEEAEELGGAVESVPSTVTVPSLVVSGSCTGTEVTIGSQKVTVSNNLWQTTLTWNASEKGERNYDVNCGDGTTSVSIGQFSFVYGAEFSLNLQTPTSVDVKNGVLTVRGTYSGSEQAKLMANVDGRVVDISSKSGYFSYVLPVNDKIGSWDISFVTLTLKDVGESDIVEKIDVTADKTSKAVNTLPPKIAVSPNTSTGEAVIVISQAEGDVIQYSIKSDDGVIEEEAEKNVRYVYKLLPGKHDYEIIAVDLAGNEARRNFVGVEYWPPAVFTVDIDGPTSRSETLPPRLPYRAGKAERKPYETVEFELTGLPNDDSGYIRRIIVQNSALTRPSAVFENNTIEKDNRYQVDVELVRNKVNKISVRVEPVKGNTKTEYKTIRLK